MISHPPLNSTKTRFATLVGRAWNSAVGWSWGLTGLRLGLGVLLLPIVLKKLPTPDLGMYYVLLSLAAVVPLVDFGFGPTIGRFVAYATGGAEMLQAHGVAQPGASMAPNYCLLWELLIATRRLYRYLALALLLVLGWWGTYVVELRIHETGSPMLTRVAWGVTLISSIWDIYSNWWEIFLRSMNEVGSAVRIAVLATSVRLVAAAVLLLSGWGLLSLPVATLLGSLIQRHLARRRCLGLLAGRERPKEVNVAKLLGVFWPNTWRLGVQCVSGYLTVNANTVICLQVLGLAANARYGLSVQLINIAAGMAVVWLEVKWPLIAQLYAQHDYAAIRKVLRQRMWLQILTFLTIGAGLVASAPVLMGRFGSGKQVLPPVWFALLAINSLLEMGSGAWGTVMLLGNRFPYLWQTVATNLLSLLLSLILVHTSSVGLGALVLGPLWAGCLLKYWYWPALGARSLGTTVLRLLFLAKQTLEPAHELPAKTQQTLMEPTPPGG